MAVCTPNMPAFPACHGSWESFWALRRVDLWCASHRISKPAAPTSRFSYPDSLCHWLECAIIFSISIPFALTSTQFSMALDLPRIILRFSNFSTCRHIPAFTHLTSHKRLWWLTLTFQARVTLVGLHSQNDSHLRTSLWFPRFILAVALLLPSPEFLSLVFHCPLLPDWPLLVLVTPMWAFLHNSQVTSFKAYNFWAS